MEEKKEGSLGDVLNGSGELKKGSLFSCICHESVAESYIVPTPPGSPPSLQAGQASPPAMRPPPPSGKPPVAVPGPTAPPPPSLAEIAWKKEILERLSRAEASETQLKAEISAIYARLEQTARADEAAKRESRSLESRLKEDISRVQTDLAGSLSAGFTRLEERLAATEAAVNSSGAERGPFAAKSDLDPISRELGALRFELSSIAGRADSLARALPELSRIAPKVDLLEGGYSEFLQSLRKVYEIDSRYSYLSGRMEEVGASVDSMASGRAKDQDRFSRLEVKTVELEGRADHLSSLFNYFRDMFEKFIGFNHKNDPLHK